MKNRARPWIRRSAGKLCHLFQKRVMDEMAYAFPVYGYADYTPLAKMKGWKALPSHYVNQDLADVWLDKD